MRDETAEQPAPLRSGLTTGSCATATALAAARLLLSGISHDAVRIILPKGKQVEMRLEFCRPHEDGAEAGTIKDAGDDPDVTHGALLYSRVRLTTESILGTSGIVRPFSCAAYIASIHQGIDVARTNGYRHIAACTGNASEDTMRRVYDLPEIALIEMGDFVGAVLKHLRKVPVDKLSLCGGFGKISKLAAGHMDLHSRHSSIDLPQMAEWAAAVGADEVLQQAIRQANTSQQALAMASAAGVALGDAVCQHALDFARSVVPAQVQVEVFAIDRQGGIVGHAGAFQ